MQQTIEQRRTVHGGDGSALSVEVSPVRFSSVDGSAMVEHDQPDRVQGFGVYIRNPLAFHVQDYGPESVDPDRRVTLDEAKAAAFKYADALADHLGCSVESALQRPEPATGPHSSLGRHLLNLGYVLEGGGAAPHYFCFAGDVADVRVTDNGGDVDNLSETDWLLGVYAGGPDGPEFFSRDVVFSLDHSDGPDIYALAPAAAAFVEGFPGNAPAAEPVEERWPCPVPFEVYSDGIAQQHYLAQFTGGYVVFSSLSGQDFPAAGDWMVTAGFGSADPEDKEAEPGREFARVRTTDGADIQQTLDSLLDVVRSAAD